MKIAGRQKEQALLHQAYQSNEAEFIAIYGRRRVGKTYLVREYFEEKGCLFVHGTGIHGANLRQQLKKLTEAISLTFFQGVSLEPPKTWDDCFALLHKQLECVEQKVVVFLDELPWMATRKSGLLQALDYYWNHYWVKNPRLILIVCGSSASWIINKIIHNKGGLHNRITRQIRLSPFTLSETKAFLDSRHVALNKEHVLSLYMAMGGIPYYLKYVEKGLTAEQNIQKIFFDRDAPLQNEFNNLFASLFDKADAYIELVELIAQKREGLNRVAIRDAAKLSIGGGRLTTRLRNLIESGFIQEYVPWGKRKGEYYKLIDEFCLFKQYWLSKRKGHHFTRNHWLNQAKTPGYMAWKGYAFESICAKHVDQILIALKIEAGAMVGSWRSLAKTQDEMGAQIDLLIDRSDNAITLCEIKHTDQPFIINKSYAKQLEHKMSVFQQKTGTQKQIFMAIIASQGIKENIYSHLLISNVVTLADLFVD